MTNDRIFIAVAVTAAYLLGATAASAPGRSRHRRGRASTTARDSSLGYWGVYA
jgi:hypothetical protein